jgi:hypothetical protein
MRKDTHPRRDLASPVLRRPLLAQESPTLATRLEATLVEFHDRYGFPGATAAIALPDGTVVTAAVGLADVENARAMTPDTDARGEHRQDLRGGDGSGARIRGASVAGGPRVRPSRGSPVVRRAAQCRRP